MSVTRSGWQIYISSLVGKAGLILLIFMVVASIYVLATYPLDYGIRVWSNPKSWADNPITVPPTWVDFFTGRDLVTHHITITTTSKGTETIAGLKFKVYELDYDLEEDGFPTYLMIKIYNVSMYSERGVYFVINFTRPDGDEIRLITFAEVPPPNSDLPYIAFSKNEKIIFLSKERSVGFSLLTYINTKYNLNYTIDKLNEINYNKVLFGVPTEEGGDVIWKPLKGVYKINVYMLGEDKDKIAMLKAVFGGESYGFLGTDDNGRDLAQGLLFGFPVALAIGFFTSIVTTAIGASLGIISGYKGGRVDEIIQRISDVVYNFPFLPIIILIVFIISRMPGFPRLLAIFGAIVALGWPGLTILIRSMVLSLKQSQFIEAAKAIGASDRRIMFKHIFPNLAPFIFAQMIFFTPGAILAEAALSFLGLGDPNIPTWGQIIEESFRAGAALNGWWWWVLPPGLLIMLAAITFVFIALGLEPIVNPKLQER